MQEAILPLFDQSNLHILLTSRPGPKDLPLNKIEKTVETIGFSEEHIKQYAEQFFSRQDVTTNSHLFFHTIKKDPNLFHLAHNPLHLHMLCSVWEKIPDKSELTGSR